MKNNSIHTCHTTIIGKYFIEGPVPVKAIKKMLREKPDIDVIALYRYFMVLVNYVGG